jgi:hypothetical protein
MRIAANAVRRIRAISVSHVAAFAPRLKRVVGYRAEEFVGEGRGHARAPVSKSRRLSPRQLDARKRRSQIKKLCTKEW